MLFHHGRTKTGVGVFAALLVVGTVEATRCQSVAHAASSFADVVRRHIVLHARRYTFDPLQIEVMQDDVVTVTLHADDVAHSFTVDGYRISKRAPAGGTITFEFRADKPGRFPFYCDLRGDDGCRRMRGELLVRPRALPSGMR